VSRRAVRATLQVALKMQKIAMGRHTCNCQQESQVRAHRLVVTARRNQQRAAIALRLSFLLIVVTRVRTAVGKNLHAKILFAAPSMAMRRRIADSKILARCAESSFQPSSSYRWTAFGDIIPQKRAERPRPAVLRVRHICARREIDATGDSQFGQVENVRPRAREQRRVPASHNERKDSRIGVS